MKIAKNCEQPFTLHISHVMNRSPTRQEYYLHGNEVLNLAYLKSNQQINMDNVPQFNLCLKGKANIARFSPSTKH